MITIQTAEPMIRELYRQYLIDHNDYKLKISVLKIVTDNKELFEKFRSYYTSGALDQFLPKSLKFSTGSTLGDSFWQQQMESIRRFVSDPRIRQVLDDMKNGRLSEDSAKIRMSALHQTIAREVITDYSNKRGLKDLLFMPFDVMKAALNNSTQIASKVVDKVASGVQEVYGDVTDAVGGVFDFAKWIVPVALVVAGVVAVKVMKD